MSENNQPTIDRIDHGVLPSNDLGRAHRFYSTFMGGELDHLTNLTIRGLNREVPQILFYTLANHKGWGLRCRIFGSRPLRRDRWTAWCTVSKSPRKSLQMWFAPPKSASSKFTGR